MTNPLTEYKEPVGGMPVPIEMSQILKFEALIEDLSQINSINGPLYMREFLKAKEVCSSYYCKLMYDYEQAKNKTKTAYAKAYLEESENYIKAKGLKSTDETKKQYVQLDPFYNQMKDNEDMLKALVMFIGNKVDKFQSAHDDAKKIFDATRDPRGSITALPSGKDSQ